MKTFSATPKDIEKSACVLARRDVFDAAGKFLTTWGTFGDGDGQFLETTSLVLDGSGNVYVSDYRNGTLQKFHLKPPLAPVEATPTP